MTQKSFDNEKRSHQQLNFNMECASLPLKVNYRQINKQIIIMHNGEKIKDVTLINLKLTWGHLEHSSEEIEMISFWNEEIEF